MNVIDDALTEAEANGELPKWGARAIARLLANHFSSGPDSLHQFAVTGTIDLPGISAALHAIAKNSDSSGMTVSLVATLAKYVRKEASQALGIKVDRTRIPEGLDEVIREHGDGIVAYLELPDATDDQNAMGEAFTARYRGRYESLPEMLDDLLELGPCRAAIRSVASQWSLQEFVTLDNSKLAARVAEEYDIVVLNGTFYVFTKLASM